MKLLLIIPVLYTLWNEINGTEMKNDFRSKNFATITYDYDF